MRNPQTYGVPMMGEGGKNVPVNPFPFAGLKVGGGVHQDNQPRDNLGGEGFQEMYVRPVEHNPNILPSPPAKRAKPFANLTVGTGEKSGGALNTGYMGSGGFPRDSDPPRAQPDHHLYAHTRTSPIVNMNIGGGMGNMGEGQYRGRLGAAPPPTTRPQPGNYPQNRGLLPFANLKVAQGNSHDPNSGCIPIHAGMGTMGDAGNERMVQEPNNQYIPQNNLPSSVPVGIPNRGHQHNVSGIGVPMRDEVAPDIYNNTINTLSARIDQLEGENKRFVREMEDMHQSMLNYEHNLFTYSCISKYGRGAIVINESGERACENCQEYRLLIVKLSECKFDEKCRLRICFKCLKEIFQKTGNYKCPSLNCQSIIDMQWTKVLGDELSEMLMFLNNLDTSRVPPQHMQPSPTQIIQNSLFAKYIFEYERIQRLESIKMDKFLTKRVFRRMSENMHYEIFKYVSSTDLLQIKLATLGGYQLTSNRLLRSRIKNYAKPRIIKFIFSRDIHNEDTSYKLQILFERTEHDKLALRFDRVLGDNGAVILGIKMSIIPNLQQLILPNNQIGDIGGAALGNNLIHAINLQLLNLYKNCIGNIGAKAIAANLRHTKLEKLFLSQNKIGNEGAVALAENTNFKHKLILELFGNGDEINDDYIQIETFKPYKSKILLIA